MSATFEPAVAFGALLREHPDTARFYDGCTAEQRQAILHQLSQIRSQEELSSFVAHLPSAAL